MLVGVGSANWVHTTGDNLYLTIPSVSPLYLTISSASPSESLVLDSSLHKSGFRLSTASSSESVEVHLGTPEIQTEIFIKGHP